MKKEVDFKMTAYDNEVVDRQHLNIIEEVMGIDSDEAVRLLALGKILGVNFSEVKQSWKESDNGVQLYEYGGREFFIGTDEELEDIAKYHLKGTYSMYELWQEAVKNGSTEDGFEEWRDDIIASEGHESILDKYNGCGMAVKVADEWVSVCNYSGF